MGMRENDMKKLDSNDPETHSTDLVAANIEQLRALFPEMVTEGPDGAVVNLDVLKVLVGDDTVSDCDEKYGLSWHGKRRARQLALTPSTGTLRPCPEESVDWDTTQNLIIEGDNLEVLKLLQKSYAGKVKLIYIDPPYNTGTDFVYTDNFQDNIKNYLELTGQVEGGARVSSNTDASGRFHTNWLNMLYPRLRLARTLLSENGAIFISIDEIELPTLRLIMDELFGNENGVSNLTLLCNPRGRAQDKHFATTHEYVVCYSRSPLEKGSFEVAKDSGQITKEYPESDDVGRYRLLELRNTHREFGKHNRRNLYYPLYFAEDGTVSVEGGTGRIPVFPDWNDGFEGCWTWGLPKASEHSHSLRAREVNGRMKIYVKDRAEGAMRMLKTILTDKAYASDKGQKAFNNLFDTKEKIFQYPKAPDLLADLIATRTSRNDTIMDFFAGTGTTGHAVMAQNATDGGSRRYILVQLPEPLEPGNKEQKAATELCDKLGKPRNIAEITKERIRRAARKIKNDNPMFAGDAGFRVFKLDSTNIHEWEANPGDLESSLLASIDHLKENRSETDILYELLLKLGLDLCVPIETRSIAGKRVYAIGGGVLITCLAEKITRENVEQIARGIAEWHKGLSPDGDTTCVFRDSAFADDVSKTNLAAILEQQGIANVRSL